MNEIEYNNTLQLFSNRIHANQNYQLYIESENNWINYVNSIYLENRNAALPDRVVFCESGPINIQNYMFSNLEFVMNSKTDKYLDQIHKGVLNVNHSNFSKREALVNLSMSNVLILDILPTHGIKLVTRERNWVNNNYRITLAQIIQDKLLNNDLGIFNQNYTNINCVFAVPPSLFTADFARQIVPENFIVRGNINAGQGHAPSRNALNRLINENLF
jgi:hypothetical protein